MDKDSWEKGYQAGLSLCPDKPEGVEVLSWYSGYIEGEAAAREIEKQRSLTDPNFNVKVKIRGGLLPKSEELADEVNAFLGRRLGDT